MAVNCAVWPGPRDAVAGLIDIDGGGFRVMAADADFVGSPTLVAVTVTVCNEVILEGAVYNPAVLIVPTAGLTDQTTPAVEFVTVAVICCVWPAVRVAETGVTETAMGGTSETAALAPAPGTDAVTVTV